MNSDVRLETISSRSGDMTMTMHLMPDGSVVGGPFSDTIQTGGKRVGDYIEFVHGDSPDTLGYLRIWAHKFEDDSGCGYSGSVIRKNIPEHKREAVEKWMSKFRKMD